jgi:hypothetical protein
VIVPVSKLPACAAATNVEVIRKITRIAVKANLAQMRPEYVLSVSIEIILNCLAILAPQKITVRYRLLTERGSACSVYSG